MVKKSTKVLSLVFAAALALVLLIGVSPTTSEGAGTAYVIDGVTTNWTHLPASLQNDDILTIMAAAGSPSGDTVINIAANANVTIIGAGNLITNLRIAENSSDTQVHTVTLQNLKIKANAAEGYIHYMGSINVTGAVEINGVSACGIYSQNSTSTLTITSANNGTLTAKGGSNSGIHTSKLSIQGSARVSAVGDGSGNSGINLGGGSPSINVGENAILNITGGVAGNAITNGSAALWITCNGIINGNAVNYGLYSIGAVTVTGSGALNLTATDPIGVGIQAASISISGVGLLADATTGISLSGAAEIILTDGATLNTKQVVLSAGSGFTMTPGTLVYYTNNSGALQTFPYTMSSAGGNQWVLSNATFASSSTLTSNPANIAVADGLTGTIKLVSQPGMVGPTTGILQVGYSAAETAAFTFTGAPTPAVTKVSGDAKITWNATTNKINVAPGLAVNTYTAVFSLNNGFTPAPTFTYTLTVSESGITVTVSPATANVEKGTTKAFTATVAGPGSPAQTVTWTVAGNADAGTTISSAGVLTVAAGETATTLTVTAKSTVDTTKTGTATVTVKEPGGGGGSNTVLIIVVVAVVLLALVGVFFFMKMKGKP